MSLGFAFASGRTIKVWPPKMYSKSKANPVGWRKTNDANLLLGPRLLQSCVSHLVFRRWLWKSQGLMQHLIPGKVT